MAKDKTNCKTKDVSSVRLKKLVVPEYYHLSGEKKDENADFAFKRFPRKRVLSFRFSHNKCD